MSSPAAGPVLLPGGQLLPRDVLLFLGAAAISNGGNWMQLIAVQALMFDLTGSGAWLGLYAVVLLVPAMLLTPYAGVLADRHSRRAILATTQVTQMAAAFALWGMLTADVATPWSVLVIGGINGIATGFQTASWQSFMPSLVEPALLARAIRANSVQYTVARLLGPVAGAVALAVGGVGAAILANALSFGVVLLMLVVVVPRPLQPQARRRVSDSVREGFAYVWTRPGLRLAALLAFVMSACGQSLQHIASAISERIYGEGGEGSAGLLVPFGVGAMVSSACLLTFGRWWRESWQMLVAASMVLVGVALLALSDRYAVGQAAYLVLGAAQVQTAVCLNTVLQHGAVDAFRGRVMSVYLLGVLGGIPLGSQAIGLVGDHLGYRLALGADATIVIAVLVWMVTDARWRRLDLPEMRSAPTRAAT